MFQAPIRCSCHGFLIADGYSLAEFNGEERIMLDDRMETDDCTAVDGQKGEMESIDFAAMPPLDLSASNAGLPDFQILDNEKIEADAQEDKQELRSTFDLPRGRDLEAEARYDRAFQECREEMSRAHLKPEKCEKSISEIAELIKRGGITDDVTDMVMHLLKTRGQGEAPLDELNKALGGHSQVELKWASPGRRDPLETVGQGGSRACHLEQRQAGKVISQHPFFADSWITVSPPALPWSKK
jgi:hypothetical protein